MGWARALVAVALLALVCRATAAAQGAAPRICPLDLDAEAARLVDGELLPVVRSHGAQLPLECPFHPSHDRMTLVRQSREMRTGHHRCAFCGSELRSRDEMIAHILANHSERIPAQSTRCLSDHCVLLGCPSQPRPEAADLKIELHKCKDIIASCAPGGIL